MMAAMDHAKGEHEVHPYPAPDIDEATYALMAIRAVTDLLCELPDMHVVDPENLNALLSIVADRLEKALAI